MGHDSVPNRRRRVTLVNRAEAVVLQQVIVMRGRFTAQESLALDPDIMVEVCVNMKRVS